MQICLRGKLCRTYFTKKFHLPLIWVCVGVCVCVFALLKESLQAKKPLNLSQRKCIYKKLHLIIRLKVTLRSLPNNMDD